MGTRKTLAAGCRILLRLVSRQRLNFNVLGIISQTKHLHRMRFILHLSNSLSFFFFYCRFVLQIRMAVDIGKQTSRDELGPEHTITMALLFANPLTNPFIYVACRKRYRNSLKLLFCRQCNGVAPADNLAFVIVYAARSLKRGQSANQASSYL